jgi:hypothetical protein
MSTIHAVAHGLTASTRIRFGNVVPTDTGIDETADYYVLAAGLTADDFQFSETDGGAAFTLAADITDGTISQGDTYTQVADGIMDAPTTPTTPTVPTVTSSVVNGVVRLSIALTGGGETDIRSDEVSITHEFSGGSPVWTHAEIRAVPSGGTTIAVPALGSTQYGVRVRRMDVYGNFSAYCSTVTHTTLVGSDSARSTGVKNAATTVTVDETGLVITNGALTFQDTYGTQVLTGGGFSGAWMDFLARRLYNATFVQGSTSDVAVSEVGTGSTAADYAASLGTGLPYWVVSASGGTVTIATDSTAMGGKAFKSQGGGGGTTTNRIYQDAPVTPGQTYRVRQVFKRAGDGTHRTFYSWRDSTHAIVGSRVMMYDNTPGATDLSYITNVDDVRAAIGIAPTSAAYLRVEWEVAHTGSGNPALVSHMDMIVGGIDPVVRTYSAGATWTKPAGLKYAIIEVVGGGGSGGGTPITAAGQAAAGSGGAGGGYARVLKLAAALGASEAVTVGAGGTAATAGAGGNAGGTSSFGTHCVATGGGAGVVGTATATSNTIAGPAGGIGTAGDILVSGSDGGEGSVIAATYNPTAYGGASGNGMGGQARASGVNGTGLTGNQYGGGSSAAGVGASQAAKAGVAGAKGVVIVTEYYE